METIHHYFNRVEDETIKAKLFANTPPRALSMEAESLEMAIYRAFYWTESPEGVEYWHKVAASFAVGLPMVKTTEVEAKPKAKRGRPKKKVS